MLICVLLYTCPYDAALLSGLKVTSSPAHCRTDAISFSTSSRALSRSLAISGKRGAPRGTIHLLYCSLQGSQLDTRGLYLFASLPYTQRVATQQQRARYIYVIRSRGDDVCSVERQDGYVGFAAWLSCYATNRGFGVCSEGAPSWIFTNSARYLQGTWRVPLTGKAARGSVLAWS